MEIKQSKEYRLFLSYSHDDIEIADTIRKLLEAPPAEFTILWDNNLSCGRGFHQQIKDFISYSHAFIPIIPTKTDKRNWVNQEIGFAMALNIPIIPIMQNSGEAPGELLQPLQAIYWNGKEDFIDRVNLRNITKLINDFCFESPALGYHARFHETRTKRIVEEANLISDQGYFEKVRQIGAFSSFHIPKEPVGDEIWAKRRGVKKEQSSDYRDYWSKEERAALENHVIQAGAELVIDPYITLAFGPEAKKIRLETLKTFFNNAIKNQYDINIAIGNNLHRSYSLTIVGNWFYAESKEGTAHKGYPNTYFTRHAPSVKSKLLEFEYIFKESKKVSIKEAIEIIDDEITKCNKIN